MHKGFFKTNVSLKVLTQIPTMASNLDAWLVFDWRYQADIGSTKTFLIVIFFSVSLYVKVPQVLKNKLNPSKFFDKFSQVQARDQPGTKIAIDILVWYWRWQGTFY